MANFQGNGRLIGYSTYVGKDNKARHIYKVINCEADPATGLYPVVLLVDILEEKQVLAELKPQDVTFEVQPTGVFKGVVNYRYINIRSAE